MIFVNEADEWHDNGSNNLSSTNRDGPLERTVEDAQKTCQSSPGHPYLSVAASSPIPASSDSGASLSLREASLMRCFIQKIAPWVSERDAARSMELDSV